MSLRGEINKNSGSIKRAISQIASSALTGRDGMPIGTKKIMGYVCQINTEGELAGTIDVQEFNYEPGEYSTEGAGHHEGVLLSAIQNNEEGYLIVPMLFSDVVIVQNPYDGKEYVLMYSQAQRIQLTTQALQGDEDSIIKIGVTEVEKFTETDEGLEKDYNELEPTKNKTLTTYTATSIKDQIISPNDEEGFSEEKTYERKTISVGDTEIVIEGDNVLINSSNNLTFKIGNNTTITEEDGKVTIKTGSTTLTEEDGKVNIDTQNCTIKGSNVEVNGSQVKITGGTLTTKGQSSVDMNGPFNAIKACPFSGAPHCGSTVAGT